MVKLTREDILKLARLAQLDLSDEEVKKFQNEISAILQYVSQLESVDIKNLPPTNQVTGLTNVMREDKLIDYGITTQQLLENVPATSNGLIKVKRTVV